MSPRLDLRNTVWLTASLALVAAPHAERLPWWVSLLVAMLVGWRLYLAHARRDLPPRALLILIVASATAGVYLQYATVFGRDAGVALLVVMLALKLLEMHTTRDAMLLIFLSYFLVVTNFLYSQTIPTALYMLACVWFITAGMIGIHYSRAPRSIGPQLRMSGVLLLQAVPLMLVVFVLFPRVQGPLWGMPTDAQRGSTGLSDTMSPGSLSALTLSEAVAFRVSFRSKVPEFNRLYWRGPVLWDYDGRTWRAPPMIFRRPSYDTRSPPVEYTVTVEPHGKAWLFALDLPGRLPPRAMATSDFQLISRQPVTARVRYDMVSFLDYTYGVDEPQEVLQRALTLPAGFNPRAIELAHRLKRQYGDDVAVMRAVFAMFGREGFSYTTTPPRLGAHTVDEFLFDTRSGFCEHYASAFVVLMRAAGIPARVVTGYLGGESNPIGDYVIVRQADAHAWAEVWLPGRGWVRADPTAAVSPARIEQGIDATGAASALPLFMHSDNAMVRRIRLTWDSLANNWNQWVLGYTPERQHALLTRVGLDDATWRTLAALMLAATGLIMLILVLITLRRLRVHVDDPVIRTYLSFCAKLARHGLARDAAEGPLTYAQRVAGARPDLDAAVRDFVALYVGLRYGGAPRERDVPQLKRLAREFRP